MAITALYHVLVAQDVAAARTFYERHFGFHPVFATDWYVQLAQKERHSLQLAIVRAGHESVPGGEQRSNRSTIVTIEVDDVDATYGYLRAAGVELLGAPRDEPWGQRHFFAVDPSGFLVDIVKPIEPTAEYAQCYTVPS